MSYLRPADCKCVIAKLPNEDPRDPEFRASSTGIRIGDILRAATDGRCHNMQDVDFRRVECAAESQTWCPPSAPVGTATAVRTPKFLGGPEEFPSLGLAASIIAFFQTLWMQITRFKGQCSTPLQAHRYHIYPFYDHDQALRESGRRNPRRSRATTSSDWDGERPRQCRASNVAQAISLGDVKSNKR